MDGDDVNTFNPSFRDVSGWLLGKVNINEKD